MAGVNWEWLLVAKGLRVSCRAQLPTPGFHGYLRTIILGSEAGAVAPKAGLGESRGGLFIGGAGQGLGTPRLPCRSLRPGQRLKEGHGQLRRRRCGQREGKGSPRGCRGRSERGKCPLASQLKFLPNLSPPTPTQEAGGTVSHGKVKGEAGEQERGHS